ncbi:MAG TPA: hypothetical protein VFH44_02615 [Solirubrobacterales bacterium]|nr:hypothetical protein [Solirubrobacterales bacterium]
MQGEPPSDSVCSVCGRGLLPGEQAIEFITRDGQRIQACELCKPRAEAAGWLRPEEMDEHGASLGRERRRSRGAGMLGGLLSRRQPEGGEEAQPRRAAAADPEPAAGEAPREPDPEPAAAPTATTIADAVTAFNRSDHRRTVAGLTRTLGPPRATALIRAGNGVSSVRLTIAWEITWYQWEVVVAGRRHEVRESGKGETIDQLGADDRSWNLMVALDGTLEEKTASSAPVEER